MDHCGRYACMMNAFRAFVSPCAIPDHKPHTHIHPYPYPYPYPHPHLRTNQKSTWIAAFSHIRAQSKPNVFRHGFTSSQLIATPTRRRNIVISSGLDDITATPDLDRKAWESQLEHKCALWDWKEMMDTLPHKPGYTQWNKVMEHLPLLLNLHYNNNRQDQLQDQVLNKVQNHGFCVRDLVVITKSLVSFGKISNAQYVYTRRKLLSLKIFEQLGNSVVSFGIQALRELSIVDKSILWYAHGYYRIKPCEALMRMYVEMCVSEGMHSFDCQALSNVLWTLARCGVDPPMELFCVWADRFMERAGELNCIEMTNAVWSWTQLKDKFDVERLVTRWMEEFQVKKNDFKASELSIALWSLSKLVRDSGTEDGLHHAFLNFEDELSAEDEEIAHSRSTNGSPSVNKMKNRLVHDLIPIWYEQTIPKLSKLRPQEVSNVIYAFANLRISPTPKFMELWEHALCNVASSMSSQSLCVCIWALARLEIVPSTSVLQTWLRCAEETMYQFSGQELSTSIWALAYMDIAVPSSFFNEWFKGALNKLGGFEVNSRKDRKLASQLFNAQALANSFWALSCLKVRLPKNFLAAYMQTLEKQVFYMKNEELTSVMGSFARIGMKPAFDVSNAMHGAFMSDHCKNMNAQSLAHWIWAYAKLGLIMQDSMYEEWLLRATLNANGFSCHGVAISLWSLARLDISTPKTMSLVHCFVRIFEAKSKFANFQDVANTIWALATLHAEITPSFFQAWTEAFTRELPRMTSDQGDRLQMIKTSMDTLSETLFQMNLTLGRRGVEIAVNEEEDEDEGYSDTEVEEEIEILEFEEIDITKDLTIVPQKKAS